MQHQKRKRTIAMVAGAALAAPVFSLTAGAPGQARAGSLLTNTNGGSVAGDNGSSRVTLDPLGGRGGRVTVVRDSYGVPSIYAHRRFSLFYGYGYAVAQDRLFQTDMTRRSATGRVAEVLGQQYVAFDRSVRSNYDPRLIQHEYNALSPKMKRVFQGYAAGFNAWIDKVRANPTKLLPKQYLEYGFRPTRITALDVVMIYVGSMANRYSDADNELGNLQLLQALIKQHGQRDGVRLFNQLKPLCDPTAPTSIARRDFVYRPRCQPSLGLADAAFARKLPDQTAGAATSRHGSAAGGAKVRATTKASMQPQVGFPPARFSSVVVLGKKKAKGANSILENGPQFEWFNPSYTYSVGLHGAGFNVTGNTPFAYPFILFGHNSSIAWGATAGNGKTDTIYIDRLNPTNPHQYLYKGHYRNFKARTELIHVKGHAPVTQTVYSDVHGLVQEIDAQHGVAYAKRRTWTGTEVQSLVAWMRSTQAHNYRQWRAQARKFNLTINWYYADRRGNIGYVYAGRFPQLPKTQDARLPAEGTGGMEWQGYRPFRTNPQVFNPTTGFVTNWNNKPAAGYPDSDYNSWGRAHRVQYLIDGVEAHRQLSAHQVVQLIKKASYADFHVTHFLPYLDRAVAAEPADSKLRQAVSLVDQWDGQLRDRNQDGRYDSPALTIMNSWMDHMLQLTLGDEVPANLAAGFTTSGYPAPGPHETSVGITQGENVVLDALLGKRSGVPQKYDVFNGQRPLAVVRSALSAAVDDLTSRYGPDMSTWLRDDAYQYYSPKNFWGVPQAGPNEGIVDVPFMNRGTENDIMTLTRRQINGQEATPPGQSGFIAPDGTKSPHYRDQLDLYNAFQFRSMAR